MTERKTISGPKAVEEAGRLMMRFAKRTGLASDLPPQRYLWTDAFAVCNFLGLAQATGEEVYSDLALRLVDQVHQVLGSYRADDPRAGWISGLSAKEGDAHPTRGGLRIGKALPERAGGEPFDEQLEWQRDGQYFHYLTKWMHALNQVYRWTGQSKFNTWARELGLAIGLSAVPLIEDEVGTRRRHLSRGAEVHEQIKALAPYLALGPEIESFWRHPQHREARTWSEHRDINEVMLATSLVPNGFLWIRQGGAA